MREDALIRALTARFPRAPEQRNAPFTSDAEIVRLGDATYALTLDEFSAEDGLNAAEPWPLGWNLTVATISDLLAVGATPRWFLDALVVTADTDETWAAAFADGMREALDVAGAALLGGDVGTGETWRFTGFALGEVPGRAITRVPTADRGVILATGRFGDGNLAALSGAAPHFECRVEEAGTLAEAASACIDTSDGLGSALAALHRLSPDLRLEIDLDRVRLAGGVAGAAADLGVPSAAFLLGAAGEYELVALVPEDAVPAGGILRRIGSFTRSPSAGVFYRKADGGLVEQPPLPDPREGPGADDYRERVIALAVSMFGKGDDA